jgi:DNA mismatch repair protein MutS2
LQIGLPGRSNAFAIARRLGLASSIVRTAQALVSPEELATESLLTEIQQAHREATAARDEVLLAQQRVAELERKLVARLAAIEGERVSVLGEARAEARRELDEVRQEIEALRAELEDRQRQSTLTEQWLAQAQARLQKKETEVAPPPPPLSPEEQRLPGQIIIGDTVWIAGLNTTGEVTALDGDSAEVQVGSFGVRVQRADLERRGRAEAAESKAMAALRDIGSSPGLELDLRGQRVEEVLPRLDKYLDDAFLAGLPFVRIVHGKGTGALRQAVRQQLRTHPLVKSHRSGEEGEGGTGVTVAYLVGD